MTDKPKSVDEILCELCDCTSLVPKECKGLISKQTCRALQQAKQQFAKLWNEKLVKLLSGINEHSWKQKPSGNLAVLMTEVTKEIGKLL